MPKVPLLSEFAFVAIVAVAIIVLHRLRPRPGTRVVSSTAIWDAVLRRRGPRAASWRRWLAVLFALAIGILLATALSGPDNQGRGAGARRAFVLVDNSGSMAAKTRDGQTRWMHALAQARSVIRSAPGLVIVADLMGHAPPSGFVSREEALAALDRLTVVSGPAPSAPPPPSGIDVHLISDGVAMLEVPRGAVVHSVFEPADNVAVTRLVVRPLAADPLHVDAFVQVFNASPVPKTVQLVLRGEPRFRLSQPLHLVAGELVDATFDVSGFEGGVLAAAAIAPSDALDSDDISYAVVPTHRLKRVVLVTRGDSALTDSLSALPGVRVESVDPARYRSGQDADAFVFEDFAPREPPPAGALLFWPRPAPWLPSANRPARGVAIDDWDRDDTVAAGVPWSALSIRRASLWTGLPNGVETVVRSGRGAVVVSGRSGVPWTAVGFLPRDSDLPLQPSFPLFLGNVLARLTEEGRVLVEPLGPVRIPFAGAEVRDGRGNLVRSWSVPDATMFEAARPGLYTAQAAGRRLQVAAALLDPRLADINRSRLAGASRAELTAGSIPLETWSSLVMIAIVLMLLDWAAYTRRITA
jgi:hypothetical protein